MTYTSILLIFCLLGICLSFGNGQKITLWMNGRSVELDMHTRRSVKIGGAEPSEGVKTGASKSNEELKTGTSKTVEDLEPGASEPVEELKTGASEPEEAGEEDRRTLYLADSMCESCEKLAPVRRHKCRKQLCDEENTAEKKIVIS